MRLGAPLFESYDDPDQWIALLKHHGYGAAYCPQIKDPFTARDYAAAAQRADIVIGEVGVWNNPLCADPKTRREALSLCKERLALADEIGARCCVNIAGSRGDQWDGPDPRNFADETFAMIVETVRDIIDSVLPQRACYALETMPWMHPDSIDSSLALVKAIDRKRFGIHFDPVNLITGPRLYHGNGNFIRDFVGAVGPHIQSVHAKDIVLRGKLTVHLDEARPGLGFLDYGVLLREIEMLDPDMPVLTEHLSAPEEYAESVRYIRGVAEKSGISIIAPRA